MAIGSEGGLVRLNGIINNKSGIIILDSGSTVSLVNPHFVNQPFKLGWSMNLRGIGPNGVKVDEWTNIYIEIQEILEVNFRVYVVPNLMFDVLLGLDFLKYQGIQINFLKEEILWHGRMLKMASIHLNDFLSNKEALINLIHIIPPEAEIKECNQIYQSINSNETGLNHSMNHSKEMGLNQSIDYIQNNQHIHGNSELNAHGLVPDSDIQEFSKARQSIDGQKTYNHNLLLSNKTERHLEPITQINSNGEFPQLQTIKAIIIPANTVKRIAVNIIGNINNLCVTEMNEELLQIGLYMPSYLIRKEYCQEEMCFPILNSCNFEIEIPADFIIASLFLLEDEIPVEYITINLDEKCIVDETEVEAEKEHLKSICNQIDPSASPKERKMLENLFAKYPDVFAKPGEIAEINCYKHRITLIEGAKPVKRSPYRKAPDLEEFERKKIEELEKLGIIRPSHSPWGMGVVIVRDGHKDGEKRSHRFCLDFRPLNRQTEKDAYPLLNIQSVLDWLANRCQKISTLDCNKGFWCIPLEEESIPLTAFVTKSAGLMEFTRLPFGVCNGSAAFQRAIGIILCGLLWKHILAFIDDLLLGNRNIEEHLQDLELSFQRFRKYGLKLSISKSHFLRERVRILGYIVSSKGIEVDPSQTKAIAAMQPPKNIREIQQFLGCTGFFRRFIEKYAGIAKPLTILLQKNRKFYWGLEQQNAFEMLKLRLQKAPVLAHYDQDAPIHIHCDASGFALGAVLLQPDKNGKERAVAYSSRTLSKDQIKYSTPDREFLANLLALEVFHPYIDGRFFKIMTDHQPLTGLKYAKTESAGRLARWAMLLQNYNYEFVYRKGAMNKVADALSRNPLPEFFDENKLEIPVLHLSEEMLPQLQLADEDCIRIFQNLAMGITSKHFAIKHDILYNMKFGYPRVVVPKILRYELLKYVHSIPISGHLGFTRCYEKLSLRYFWPTMSADLSNFIKTCNSCLSNKVSREKRYGLLKPIPIPTTIFERISSDICGIYPETMRGNKYIINCIDHYSKWAELKAIPNQNAEETVKFFEEIFCRFSSPRFLLSDNGGNYISNLLKLHAQKYNVKHLFISAYNSRSNGQAERMHQTMNQMLTHFVNSHHTDWDEYLPQIQFAYNTTVQESTGQTPFRIVFNREPTFPYEYSTPGILRKNSDIEEIRKMVKLRLEKEQQRYKEREDKHRKEIEFKIGDRVKLRFPKKVLKNHSKKFIPNYLGEYEVIEKVNDLNYKLRCVKTNQITKGHVARMHKILS